MNRKIVKSLLLVMVLMINAPFVFGDINGRIVGGEPSERNDWPYMTALMFKGAEISAGNEQFNAYFMEGVPTKTFAGLLVSCGSGFSKCQGAEGKVCLIERGQTFFTEKVENCKDGGGIAAIIYNNEDDDFLGIAESTIPAISTNRDNGLALFNYINKVVKFDYVDTIPEFSFCGGSYIGGRWVVTAAHCVLGVSPNALKLNIGGTDLSLNQDNLFDVVDIALHRNYFNGVENDIAILELSAEPQGIKPILLADEKLLEEVTANRSAVKVIGRGTKAPQTLLDPAPLEFPDPALYEVELNLIDNNSCNATLNQYMIDNDIILSANQVNDNMLCAGNLSGGVGSCKGDSGGPLILQKDGAEYLVGITSWGFGCAQEDVYGVYTRVPFFKSSLDDVLSDELQVSFVSHSVDDPDSFQNNGGGTRKSSSGSSGVSVLWSLAVFILLVTRFFRARPNNI